MNPIFVTTEGAALEDAQSVEETAERNAASQKHYKNGFAAKRRRVPPTRATRGGRGARNGGPPMRFEGPAGAAWYMNPAWWIAGAVIYLAWRKK